MFLVLLEDGEGGGGGGEVGEGYEVVCVVRV